MRDTLSPGKGGLLECPQADYRQTHPPIPAPGAGWHFDPLLRRMSFPVRARPVDVGSELAAAVEEACPQRPLRLCVLPPRSPPLPGRVERAPPNPSRAVLNLGSLLVFAPAPRPCTSNSDPGNGPPTRSAPTRLSATSPHSGSSTNPSLIPPDRSQRVTHPLDEDRDLTFHKSSLH